MKPAMKSHKRHCSFSRTLSKTTLLAKIRDAIGNNKELKNLICIDGGQNRKTPRRFIVKRSQERPNNQ
jgi:hypothetical protein